MGLFLSNLLVNHRGSSDADDLVLQGNGGKRSDNSSYVLILCAQFEEGVNAKVEHDLRMLFGLVPQHVVDRVDQCWHPSSSLDRAREMIVEEIDELSELFR